MIFVDSHVHIYDCFDVDYLFDAALMNFQMAAKQKGTTHQASFVLLLTEGATEDWFHDVLKNSGRDGQGKKEISANWVGLFSEDLDSLTVFQNNCAESEMHLVGGRQVVTREKIEVLALYCTDFITDGLPLDETVDAVQRHGGIPVLPWGVGKWMGKRGGIIQRFLSTHPEKHIFLGDNGGRPRFWPTPNLFHLANKRGVTVLPGTDPLPIPAEAARVGSYGFCLDEKTIHGDSPVNCLKNALLSGDPSLSTFGGLLDNRLFLLNQLRLRFAS